MAVIAVQQPAATAVVGGTTIDETSGRSLPGVAVYLTIVHLNGGEVSRKTTSDAAGRFEFIDLRPGVVHLSARLDGWMQAHLPSEHPEELEQAFMVPPPGIQLAQGQRLAQVRLGMRQFATITGRVVDESGAPVSGAKVSAMPVGLVAGRQAVVSGSEVKTDPQGGYRLTSLFAGDYVMTATVPFPRIREIATSLRALFVFRRSFYPEAGGVDAPRPIAVEWGQAISSVDFRLQKGPAVRVSGRVTGADSFRSQAYVHLEWTEPLSRQDQLFVANSYLDSQGNFTLAPVPPGRYILTTYGAQSRSGRMLWTRHPVMVSSEHITRLNVPVSEGLRIAGHVRFEGARSRPSAEEIERIVVALRPPEAFYGSDVMPPHTTVRTDGTFVSAEAAAGHYLLYAWSLPTGWTLRSAMVAGKDAADSPIELTSDLSGAVLTFTDSAPRLRGRVLNTSGAPAASAKVLIFPADASLWTDFGMARRLRWATTKQDGTYDLGWLPAGDYLVIAVSSFPARGWRDEALLKVLAPSALRLALREGRDMSQELRVNSETISFGKWDTP